MTLKTALTLFVTSFAFSTMAEAALTVVPKNPEVQNDKFLASLNLDEDQMFRAKFDTDFTYISKKSQEKSISCYSLVTLDHTGQKVAQTTGVDIKLSHVSYGNRFSQEQSIRLVQAQLLNSLQEHGELLIKGAAGNFEFNGHEKNFLSVIYNESKDKSYCAVM